MSKTKSVVKHRYFKGERAQRGAGEYTRYVEYRQGEDREEKARKFFDRDDAGIEGEKVRELWKEQGKRGPVMHEFILSPGLNTVDQQEYTREIMDKLSRTKGQELQWYGVEHRNTEHHHIHVLIAGKDAEGREVRINRNDHKYIKEWGDRYLEREHQLDRYLQREEERLPVMRTYEPDRGDALFNSLFGRDHDTPGRSEQSRSRENVREKKEPEKAPEKAPEPRAWTRENIDFERIDDDDKIRLRNGVQISKYDSSDYLKEIDDELRAGPYRNWLQKEDHSKMWSWIGTKEKAGEDFYGQPPLKDDYERGAEAGTSKEWDKERAIAELDDENKIYRNGEAYTKYSSLEELKTIDKALKNKEVERATKEEYSQLRQWIKEKERFGEDFHENKDRKAFEKEEQERLARREKRDKKREEEKNRQANREFQELDRNSQKGYQRDWKSGGDLGPRGRQQRRFELYGRTSDVHANYQMNMNRQRLKDLMERDPENKESYQQQLDELNKSYREEQQYREANRGTEPDKGFERERQSGYAAPRKSREQRLVESRGRDSDTHARYQMNQNRERLTQAMERDPENAAQYQKELDWLKESYLDQQRDFEKLDLEDIFGRDDRDRTDDRDKKDDREKGEVDRVGDEERKPEDERTEDKDRAEDREEGSAQQEDQGVKSEESSQAEDAPVLEEERELEPDDLHRTGNELEETKEEQTTEEQIDSTEPKLEETQQLEVSELEQSLETPELEPEPKPDEERTTEDRDDERHERHDRDDRDDFGR